MATGNAITRWRTPNGLRATTSQATISVDLKAWPAVDEGVLVSVTFHVSVNGGAATDQVATETVRLQDVGAQPSPLPGAPTSGFAGCWQCGFDLDCSGLAGGTVEISATVRTQLSGTDYDTEVAAITVYNDADGTDRRPCPYTMFVSPTGSGSNPGTEGSPLQFWWQAVNALVAAGGTYNLRHARIVMLPGAHVTGDELTYVPAWESELGWLEVEFRAGATISRVWNEATGGTEFPASYWPMPGNGAGTRCGVRVINAEIIDAGLVGYVPEDVTGQFWIDGGSSRSRHSDGTNLLAKFFDFDGPPAGFDGPGTASWFATGHTRGGVLNGFVGAELTRDCSVERWLSLAYYSTGTSVLEVVNCFSDDQDYIYEDEEGAVLGLIDYLGSADFTVTVEASGTYAGKMRVTMASPPYDVAAHAASLVGSLHLGLRLTGFSSGSNGDFEVLDAGAGYFILDNDSAVEETGPSGARVVTCDRTTARTWNDAVHPDLWRVQGDQLRPIVQGLGVGLNVRSTQGLFASGITCTEAVLEEISMPANLRNNFDSSAMPRARMRWWTCAGPVDFGGGATAVDAVFHDIVCGSTSGFPAAAAVVERIHVISGSPVGTDGTSGSWFEDYANTGYLPAAGVRGNDSGLGSRPNAAKWSTDSAWSQGVGAWPAGLLDWSYSDGPTEGGIAGTLTIGTGAILGGLSASLSPGSLLTGSRDTETAFESTRTLGVALEGSRTQTSTYTGTTE